MANEKAIETKNIKKSLNYEDKVIKKIAGIAASEVPGIFTMTGGFIGNITDKFRDSEDKTKGINVEVGQTQVALDMNAVCEYGRNVPDLFDQVTEKIAESLKLMTGLELVEINLHVEDVMTKEEFEKQKYGLQSRPANKEELPPAGKTTRVE